MKCALGLIEVEYELGIHFGLNYRFQGLDWQTMNQSQKDLSSFFYYATACLVKNSGGFDKVKTIQKKR